MKPVIGVIVGNRGFFPDHLVQEGRKEILEVLEKSGCEPVALGIKDSKLGGVETLAEAKKCAELFKKNRERIDGIIVTLPNFGDERGVADTLRMADLDVPVLMQASPDDPKHMAASNRRDSFCGKISACNNLLQYGIPFSLTANHTVAVTSDEFKKEVDKFLSVCRVVKGIKNAKIGAIGARPAAFNTCRYSEKILADHGVNVETIDLSEIFGRIEKLSDSDGDVTKKLKDLKEYIPAPNVTEKNLVKMAKLGVVFDNFIEENELDATAVQCWTSMEEYYGVVPCTMMSMLSNSLHPSACEVDITGALSMYALQLASQSPSALLDWNNNFGDDPDKCILFHCSNLPKHFFDKAEMKFQAIIAGSVGADNTQGTVEGIIRPHPMTFARFSTYDTAGKLLCYVGEGSFTDDSLESFGGLGAAHIPNLQDLLKFICNHGFEHHVAVSLSRVAEILHEAFTNYLGIDTYHHC